MWTAQLPTELLADILITLPVKCLLRLRCVCKTWKSLIDSSTFVKSHLSKNHNSKIYLIRGDGSGTMENEMFFAEVDLQNCPHRLVFQSLLLPVGSLLYIQVLGSCNGLICLSTSHFERIVLVNPTTRDYRLLPPISKWFEYSKFGLGYDCSVDEYKVVLIPRDGSEVNVYGSRSNSWRQVDVVNEKFTVATLDSARCAYPSYGDYCHGALHWIMHGSKHIFCIMTCHIVNEKFTVAEYDKDLFGNPDDVFLEVVGERLCLCCVHDAEEGEGIYMDIWVMEEYGVRESWSKLGTFDGFIKPLAFSICEKRLLVQVDYCSLDGCECSLHWYDLDNKSMECTSSLKFSSYHVCLQSLIWAGGETPLKLST